MTAPGEDAPLGSQDSSRGDPRPDLRDVYRSQLQASIGGWTGMLVAAVPPVVFVVVNALASLRSAIIAAVASGVLLAGYRLARKQSVQQAVSGLVGVLIAAAIAARSGHARDYFLFGIWTSFAYAVPFAGSLLVRRPLVGVVWEFLDPSPPDPLGTPWYRRRPLLRAYAMATGFAALLFLARGAVQAALYHENATGWLAFARVVMGYPLTVLAVAAGYWVVRRGRRAVAATSEDG